MINKYTDDDYCDIYQNKLCDNCGKCLEMDGIDTKAIKIEDIAKTKEENKILEEEFLNNLKSSLDDEQLKEFEESNVDLKALYSKFIDSTDLKVNEIETNENVGYEDAFEHIEYLDDTDLFDEESIDELTEEVYPGVRRFKSKK
ncbi:hypothetical protein [Clostridium weizhouense]|uniref:Uncharacterized protein n=1 Tax=Clostridium weizhouense TaxID=2859781 RepID=A0ABS7ALJ4_9CLOT|nr:hypothetical protein [Clostridium weizhouense]MBW6409539.1 hypothetical protein [Clostridium weizhouense]